jgi:uncharacterized protein YbcI
MTSRAATTRPHTDSSGEPAAPATLEIANEMVRAYKEAIGRGPTKAGVHFARADTLIVVLENTMTQEERTLAALGEVERLRQNRQVLTTALEDRFRSIVERAVGRRTLAFVSGFDTRRDIAVEVFTFEPEPGDDQDETTRSARARPSVAT